jgi:excisionase family DNA binding protein
MTADDDRYQHIFDDTLLTKDEVCRMLRLSKSQVNTLMRTGRLPYYKIGRKVLFSLREIKEWLEGHRRN